VDGSGNVYISDVSNGRVLKETLSAGTYTQSVVADSATNGLSNPYGVAVDGSGNVYIGDSYYDPSVRADKGQVLKETLAAGSYTQSVVANAASNGLIGPWAVAVDGSGNVYITDGYADPFSGMNSSRVLKETPSAGGYTQSLVANAANNGLNDPTGVGVDSGGNVYFADFTDNEVLKEDFADPPTLNVGATGTAKPTAATVINDGNASLIFSVPAAGDNPNVSANFAWDPSSTCRQTTASSSAAYEIAAGARCTMVFDFEPTSGGTSSGVAELTDNNLNVTGAVQGIQLIGVLGSQTITFPQPVSPVYSGAAPITLSATGGASGNPVIFSVVSGPGSLSGTNNSVLNLTGWGTVVIAANQAGNIDYNAAPQVTQSITVVYSQSAALTSPTPGSVLTGSSATFTWSPGDGATEYMLYLGSTGVRSNNLYNSGPTTATSVNVTDLPTNGETIYARLYSLIGGAWRSLDYTYKAVSLATLTSPGPNSTLAGSSVTFAWSAGTGVTKYELYLGSGKGTGDLYHSGYTTARSVNVAGLPVDGRKIYARLYSYVGGAWQYLDYIYTAE
jgi:hypothetical protein